MRVTRTYPKVVYNAPSGNAVTSADWHRSPPVVTPPVIIILTGFLLLNDNTSYLLVNNDV